MGKVVEYTSYPEAYQDLALGRTDYVVNTIINIKALVIEKNNRPDAYVRPVAWRGSEMMGVSAQNNTIHLAIAAWEWPPAVPVPQQLRLKVTSQIHKRRDNLYGAPGWFDRDPVAVVTLAVGSSP